MITIIVPAYNEEEKLSETIENLLEAQKKAGNIPLDIVIVNDGSSDRTPEIISKIESKLPIVRSIHHERNMGIGAGVVEVIKIAKYPKIMLAAGDNDVSRDMLVNLFKNRDKADVILGYYLNKEDRGRTRNIVSTIFGLIYMCSFNVFVQYMNGPSIWSTSLIRQLNIRSTRFSIGAEVNTKLLCSGCTFHEVSGYMQTGVDRTTNVNLKNFLEAVDIFLRLVIEVKFLKKPLLNKKPKRVF